MIAGGIIALLLLVRSNIRFRNKAKEVKDDTLFQTILNTTDRNEVWRLLRIYINDKQKSFLQFASETYSDITSGFVNDNAKLLSRTSKSLSSERMC